MSIAEEIEKLQALHAQGALTDDEFAQAKATLLDQRSDGLSASDVDELSMEVEYLRLKKEINRLDLDWERERESYMIRGRYGARYMPSESRSVLGVIVVIGAGVYMLFSWPSSNSGLGLPLALMFMIIGVVACVYQFDKARAYKKAQWRYQEHRNDLSAQLTSARQKRYE